MRLLATTTLASLALATPAAAEAPGECDHCVVPVVTPAAPSDLARRIGIGLRAVSMSLGDDQTETDYGGGGLAASYRLSRRWEVALSLDGLSSEGGAELHATLLAARFHLTPHRRWDWYVMAGIGAVHEGDDDGASRGQLHAGAGLQRRFHRWGLSAELDLVGVGPREGPDDEMAALSSEPAPVMTADDGLAGAQLSLAAMYYF